MDHYDQLYYAPRLLYCYLVHWQQQYVPVHQVPKRTNFHKFTEVITGRVYCSSNAYIFMYIEVIWQLPLYLSPIRNKNLETCISFCV